MKPSGIAPEVTPRTLVGMSGISGMPLVEIISYDPGLRRVTYRYVRMENVRHTCKPWITYASGPVVLNCTSYLKMGPIVVGARVGLWYWLCTLRHYALRDGAPLRWWLYVLGD